VNKTWRYSLVARVSFLCSSDGAEWFIFSTDSFFFFFLCIFSLIPLPTHSPVSQRLSTASQWTSIFQRAPSGLRLLLLLLLFFLFFLLLPYFRRVRTHMHAHTQIVALQIWILRHWRVSLKLISWEFSSSGMPSSYSTWYNIYIHIYIYIHVYIYTRIYMYLYSFTWNGNS